MNRNREMVPLRPACTVNRHHLHHHPHGQTAGAGGVRVPFRNMEGANAQYSIPLLIAMPACVL